MSFHDAIDCHIKDPQVISIGQLSTAMTKFKDTAEYLASVRSMPTEDLNAIALAKRDRICGNFGTESTEETKIASAHLKSNPTDEHDHMKSADYRRKEDAGLLNQPIRTDP